MPVKLYDLRKKDYPNDVEFRTLQVHICPTCNSRTNKAINTGFPGTYLSPICPNILKDWHTTVAELKVAQLKVETINSVKIFLAAEVSRILEMRHDKSDDDIEGDADKTLVW